MSNPKLQFFSERLKQRRNHVGLSVEQFATRANVSERALADYEKGTSTPSGEKILRFAELLNCEVGWLFGEDPKPNARLEAMPTRSVNKIPVVSWATAGAGGNFHDCAEQIAEYLECDTKDANAYALIIEGDSMMPKFEPGDRVVFEPNRQAVNGDFVVVRVAENGHVFFKLFHTFGAKGDMVRLTSFNPAYPPLEFPLKAFRFIHPMHSMLRRYRR